MVRDPGKTLQDARNFRLRETKQTAKQSLDSTDLVDIWKINNRFRGSLNLDLKGIAKKANVDVELLDGTGKVVAKSRLQGNRAEQLSNVFLETGTFYVRVKLKRGSAASQYTLSMFATPAADQVGDTFETARILTGQPVSDFVGTSDPNDFVGLIPLVSGQIKFDLVGLSDDANIEVYDSTRTLVAASTNSGATPETIQQSLTSIAGSPYYVRIFPAPGKDTSYTLNYTFTPGTITTTASNLQYIDVVPGTGATPQLGQKLTVQYTGILTNGSKFDSSRDRGTPFVFNLGGNVIDGWNEGFSTMKVGGRRQLIIPPELGYGRFGQGSIPPNATLIFDVELLSIG